ncbi:ArsR/SmtB family transcription factor [Halosimplex salinum]|uniref:ArsR/SmtB family transcription factor n=1 Tax=Halosimplex salinum TaxID=1710538 RepID=UPI000F4A000A|nr:winged helix-turn-helix domain-containing protein [Halosimplex salinum]
MTAERREDETVTDESEGEPAAASVPEPDGLPPSDAFGALGGETRLEIVRAIADETPRTFSALFDATDEDTSAGFAYHLRQLTDGFVRQREDERYELTDAGRSVARALRAGTYTASVDRDPIELDDDCPFCGDVALVATVVDNVTEIDCENCDAPLLQLSFPAGGYASHDADDLPEALDAHHRRRIASFGDGVCPDCAGTVSTTVEAVADRDATAPSDPQETGTEHVPARTVFECEACGADLRCPVALTLLDHPAVVAFYHDHARDVRERPIWNVGSEWRERVVSRDPWCVLVSTRLDGEDLRLYVARDGTVVDHRRVDVGEDHTSESASDRSRRDSGASA